MSTSHDRPHAPPIFFDAVLLLALTVGFAGYVLAANPQHLVQSQGGDFPHYAQLAAEPIDNTVASPWRYRLLNPILASWLIAAGLGTEVAFFALTALFAWASCVLMLIYLRELGLPTFGARAGMLLFAVSVGAYIPLRRYFGYTDALTNFFILLVLILAARRRYVHTAVALAVGTLAKESMLLLLPFLAWRSIAVGRWRAAAMLIAAPLAVFLLLRFAITPDPSGASRIALTLDTQMAYWQTAMVHGVGRWLLWSFAYSMGPVWLLAVAALRENAKFATTMFLYAVTMIVPLTRTTDTERALMLLFPVVFPIAAHALEQCRGRHEVLVAAVAIAATWLAQLTFDWTVTTRVGPVNAKDVTFVALCALPALALLRAKRPQHAPPLRWPAHG